MPAMAQVCHDGFFDSSKSQIAEGIPLDKLPRPIVFNVSMILQFNGQPLS
jgi:hypothetical protein